MEQRYEIMERIAVGGMAEIYRAQVCGAGGFEKPVVVKKILPAFTRDHEFVEMFIEEAKLAGTLQHGNIVQVYDLGVADDEYFIVMEYMNGRDLGDVMHFAGLREIHIGVREAVYIGQQVCAGLDYAHRKLGPDGEPLGIIHRDVSPQNIILSFEGEVKLTDFGIARAKTRAARTQVGFLKGKYGYMSPEQARAQSLDQRSDVFNVGILLYELLVGKRLFLGSSDFSTLNLMRNAALPPASRFMPDLPEALEAIVMKALAAAPKDRFQTAGEMERALARFSFKSSLVATADDIARLLERIFGKPKTPPSGTKGTRVIALTALPSDKGGRQATRRPPTVPLGPAAATPRPARTSKPEPAAQASSAGEASPTASPSGTGTPAPARSAGATGDPHPDASPTRRPEPPTPPPADAAAPWARKTKGPSTLDMPFRPRKPKSRALGRPPGISRPVQAAVYLLCFALPFGGVTFALWPESGEAAPVLREVEAARLARGALPAAVSGRRPAHAPEALLLVDADVPGAAVRIDGHPAQGRTPLAIPVAAGSEVAVEVSAPGRLPWTGRAVIPPDSRVVRLEANLALAGGGLRVVSRPRGADVYVNDIHTGTTPLRLDPLPPEAHVRVSADGYACWRSRIDPQDTMAALQVQLVPERRAGRLEIVSPHHRTRVRVDDAQPVLIDQHETLAVVSGRRRVRVRDDAGAVRTYTVDVPVGGQVRLFVDFSTDADG